MTNQKALAVAALERAPAEGVAAVIELLRAYGPEPTPAAVEEAAAWNAAVSVERRQALIGQSITRDEAAEILLVPEQVEEGLDRTAVEYEIKHTWTIAAPERS
jgi:hypothetical protein